MVELSDILQGLTYLFAAGSVGMLGWLVYEVHGIWKDYKAGIELEPILDRLYEQELYMFRGATPMRWGMSSSPMPERGSLEWWAEAGLYRALKEKKSA